MNGAIYYYSNTGNTKLACEFIAKSITVVNWECIDILKNEGGSVDSYDIVGFAASADFLSPSPIVKTFIKNIPLCNGKPAFVFNTFGNFNGATLRIMAELVSSRGFHLFAGHALHTPENIATMIQMGLANVQAPNEKEMKAFSHFINCLKDSAAALQEGIAVKKLNKFRIPLIQKFIPALPRSISKSQMSGKTVDTALCTKCNKCVMACPYGAIQIKEWPVFDLEKCQFCWRCYNLCPTKAIYTKKFRGVGHYPRPVDPLIDKLTVR
jgi:ferredoxin/flavodoxin